MRELKISAQLVPLDGLIENTSRAGIRADLEHV